MNEQKNRIPKIKRSGIMQAVNLQNRMAPEKKLDLDLDELNQSVESLEQAVINMQTPPNNQQPSPFTIVPNDVKTTSKPSIEDVLKDTSNDSDGSFDYSNLLSKKWTLLSIGENVKDLLGTFLKFFNQILSALNSIKISIESLEPTKKQYQKLESDFRILKEQFDISEKNLESCSVRFAEFSKLFREFRELNPVLHEKNRQWFDAVSEKINEDLNVE